MIQRAIISVLAVIAIVGLYKWYSGAEHPSKSIPTITQQTAVKIKVPLDLTGNWRSDKPKVTAVIQNGTIEVTSVTESGGSVRWWYGTFDNPQDGATGITSKGMYDVNKIYLSSADTKDFVYHDKMLKFQIAVMGVTRVVEMKRV